MRYYILAILLLSIFAPSATAQTNSWENLKQIRPGHKIKLVDVNLKAWRGKLVTVSDEAITIQNGRKKQEIAVERPNVLRVTDLQRSNHARNALIGLAVGVALGYAVTNPSEDADRAIGIALLFAAPGAAGGALVTSYPTIYGVKSGLSITASNPPGSSAGMS